MTIWMKKARYFRLVIVVSLLAPTASQEDSVKLRYLSRFIHQNEPSHHARFNIPEYVVNEKPFARSDFESIIRRGIPSVLIGVTGLEDPLLSLSCSDFSTRWPDASMRAEYTGRPEPDTFVKLGDSKWVNDTKSPIGMNAPTGDCDDNVSRESRPAVAPFVWHVKDRVIRSIKEEISGMFQGLGFLESGSLMDAHIRDSMEFWFQQVGAGTFAHNDGYCHSVFSVQLRGHKKWRLMLAPQVERLSRDIFDEFDSGIYNSVHKWEPDFEVILEEGDGILFPPGYMHETRTVEGPTAEDKCATSVTFNIPLPMPSRFIREFLPRFSVSREIHRCMRRWESFVTARASAMKWESPLPESKQAFLVTTDIFDLIDSNLDNFISLEELETYLKSSSESDMFRKMKSVEFGDLTFVFDPRRRPTDEMFSEAFHIRAKDTLDMWDVNEDSFASFDEVRDVVEYFQYYRWRQELVDTAVTFEDPSGELIDIPIGSELFKKRLDIVEGILAKVRPSGPPVLDKSKYQRFDNKRDEL